MDHHDDDHHNKQKQQKKFGIGKSVMVLLRIRALVVTKGVQAAGVFSVLFLPPSDLLTFTSGPSSINIEY